MLEKVFWFGVGFLVARYFILKDPASYQAKEENAIDEIRNGVHDLIKKYAPEADDQQVGADVIATVK
jgi:hypothetical protein